MQTRSLAADWCLRHRLEFLRKGELILEKKGIILPPTTISPQFTSTWSASHCTKTLGTKHPSYSSKIPNPCSLIMFFLRSSNFLIMPPKYLLFHLLPAVPDVLLPTFDFSLPAALTFLIFWKRWKRFLVMKLIMNSLNMVSKSTCYWIYLCSTLLNFKSSWFPFLLKRLSKLQKKSNSYKKLIHIAMHK